MNAVAQPPGPASLPLEGIKGTAICLRSSDARNQRTPASDTPNPKPYLMMPRVKPGLDTAAALFETRRYASIKNATTEVRRARQGRKRPGRSDAALGPARGWMLFAQGRAAGVRGVAWQARAATLLSWLTRPAPNAAPPAPAAAAGLQTCTAHACSGTSRRA